MLYDSGYFHLASSLHEPLHPSDSFLFVCVLVFDKQRYLIYMNVSGLQCQKRNAEIILFMLMSFICIFAFSNMLKMSFYPKETGTCHEVFPYVKRVYFIFHIIYQY